jgi:hypothetical protein
MLLLDTSCRARSLSPCHLDRVKAPNWGQQTPIYRDGKNPHLLHCAEIVMLARPRLTKRPDQPSAEKPKDQARPAEQRFLLQVDGQTKRSFSSKEPAATAGAAAKKAYPVVMVTIVDSEDGPIEES